MKRFYVRDLKKQYPDKPSECLKCQLFLHCKSYKLPYRVFHAGKVNKKILLVGQNAGEQEDTEGRVFVGKSGQLMKEYVEDYFSDYLVYVTNAVKCYTPEKPELIHVRACQKFLKEDIETINPDVIIALGDIAKKSLQELGVSFLTSVHPAFVLRGGSNTSVHTAFTRCVYILEDTIEKIPYESSLSKRNKILERLLKKDILAFDLEWNKDGKIHTFGISDGKIAIALPFDLKVVEQILQNPRKSLVGHNILSDVTQLLRYGIEPKCHFVDTMIMQRVVAPYLHELSLKEWAESYLMIERYWEKITSDSYEDYSEELARYCAGDVFSTWKLYEYMKDEFQEEIRSMKNALELDFMMIIPTAYMIHHGIKLDEGKLEKVRQEIYSELIVLESKLTEKYGINVRSNKQLLEKLREEGYQIQSVAKDVLHTLDSKLAKEVLQYRELYTLYSRYLARVTDYCDSNGVIHPDIRISGASTGRPTCTNPNLLNVNPRVRRIFRSVFDDGVLVSADRNQAEFRVLGYLSRSKKILEGYRNGVDFHTLTANLVEVDRKTAKRLNFAFVYGATESTLRAVLIDAGYSQSEAEKLVEKYMTAMKELEIESYHEALLKQAKEKGYVESPFGRRGYRLNYTQIVNYPIQSFASDINKFGIIHLFYEMKKANLVSRIWLDFYDAIEIDVYKPELEVVRELINSIPTRIPDIYSLGEYHIPIEVTEKGTNWS